MIMQSPFRPVSSLLLVLPDSEFAEYYIEAHKLVEREPDILKRIDEDLDHYAREKKRLRILDKQWEESNQLTLPTIEIREEEIDVAKLKLGIGRPRMSAYVAYMFMMGRGYYGGIKGSAGDVFTSESMTMRIFLENQGLAMPSQNSIYDNINAVSNTTRQYILDAQIRMIIDERLDDFKNLTFDSTAVSANVRWPRDSVIMSQLIKRAYHRGKSLHKFGMKDMETRYFPVLIKDIQSLSNKINMESGKPKSAQKRKKYYEKLIIHVDKAIKLFGREIVHIEEEMNNVVIKPSCYSRLARLVEMIKDDVVNIKKVREYCHNRIFENISTPSKDKILSVSDKDAAYIQKGNREAKIGYKPQIGRSKKGFITSMSVPQGNASDSGQLPEIIDDSINRTSVIPDVISTDDGYVNSSIRNKYIDKGVKVFSFSGAKGKKVISEGDWETEEYRKARNDRSAIESLMYTIKYGFDFGHVMRRGLENVRAELLEKVLSYNFCRIIEIRKRKQMPLLKTA